MARILFSKAAVLVGSLVIVAGCGSAGSSIAPDTNAATSIASSTSPPLSTTSSDSTTSGTVSPTTGPPVAVTLDAIAAILCDATPERESPEAEKYTKASYGCIHGSEGVRIDFYGSPDQQTTANEVVLDYYKSQGDSRALSDLPIGCGAQWSFGVDSNETRDALIGALNKAGLVTALC